MKKYKSLSFLIKNYISVEQVKPVEKKIPLSIETIIKSSVSNLISQKRLFLEKSSKPEDLYNRIDAFNSTIYEFPYINLGYFKENPSPDITILKEILINQLKSSFYLPSNSLFAFYQFLLISNDKSQKENIAFIQELDKMVVRRSLNMTYFKATELLWINCLRDKMIRNTEMTNYLINQVMNHFFHKNQQIPRNPLLKSMFTQIFHSYQIPSTFLKFSNETVHLHDFKTLNISEILRFLHQNKVKPINIFQQIDGYIAVANEEGSNKIYEIVDLSVYGMEIGVYKRIKMEYWKEKGKNVELIWINTDDQEKIIEMKKF